MELKPTKDRIASLGQRLVALRGHLDVDGAKLRVAEIDNLAAVPEFWNDQARAQGLLREQAQRKGAADGWEKQRKALDDVELLLQLGEEASDEATLKEADVASLDVEKAVEVMEFARMLSGEHDRQHALLSINAGAGGTDAQDWAQMLVRMYLRWCERHGMKVEMLDEQPGEEAGIKSASFLVEGDWAYGYLRAENGVHRLVRISPFDANARRQTAFASVFVYPDLDDTIEIDLRKEDIEVQTYRSGGAGGQHVNKTDSAVRMIHHPSGIVVTCQSERSQIKNRSSAMKMLRARLYEKQQAEQVAKMGEVHGRKKAIEWGSQIRSYVLAPYRQVNDHRTEMKVSNVDEVLDGDIDEFIKGYLLMGEADENAPAEP
ncbi:MAG: peptide chain release factor 2 [Polyangia bacterium]